MLDPDAVGYDLRCMWSLQVPDDGSTDTHHHKRVNYALNRIIQIQDSILESCEPNTACSRDQSHPNVGYQV